MDYYKVVLLEKEDSANNCVVGASGLMLNDHFVITTANLFGSLEDFDSIKSNSNIAINVIQKNSRDLFLVRKATIFDVCVVNSLKTSNGFILQSWAIDSIENNTNLNNILSVFFILTVEPFKRRESLHDVFIQLWNDIGFLTINKGDSIYIDGAPFGNRNFINSRSKGIVSNIMGNDSCLIVSDCPSTPGSEGSPVYSENKSNAPLGIVISSANWWRGEWLGLTLILDLRCLIGEIISVPVKLINLQQKTLNTKLLATTEFSIVQIYSGYSWGTGILLNKEKGLFITNSHIINNPVLKLFYKGNEYPGKCLWQASTDTGLDLAVFQSKEITNRGIKSIVISDNPCRLGDTVYSAGFSIFPKECSPTPTLSKGYVSLCSSYMMQTSCSVHAGASGGAILNDVGELIGIIVNNIKINESGVVFPRINMAIPIFYIKDIIEEYLKTNNIHSLDSLNKVQQNAQLAWNQLPAHL